MKSSKLLISFCLIFLTTILSAQNTFIYVSDAGNFNNPPWQILKYNLDGSNPQVFIDNSFFTGEGIGWPQDILFLEDQNAVLISNLVGNRITKHDANTGAYIEDFATVSGGPTRMKIGPDNLLYVLQWSNADNKVKRYQLDGTFVDEFTSVGVVQSIGMDWDSAGNFYVSSYGGSTIRKFDSSGNDQGIFIDMQLAGPTNIMFETNGNILVLNWNAGNVQRFDSAGNHIETFTTSVTQPEGIAKHPVNGNYFIGNGGAGQVDQFQPDGTFVESTIPSGSGGLIQPNAVVIRDASLSVKDQNSLKSFLTPSYGSEFFLNNFEIKGVDYLDVYTILGKKVDTIYPNQKSWSATNLSEGVYFIITSIQGRKFHQKIVVKK